MARRLLLVCVTSAPEDYFGGGTFLVEVNSGLELQDWENTKQRLEEYGFVLFVSEPPVTSACDLLSSMYAPPISAECPDYLGVNECRERLAELSQLVKKG